MLGVEYLHVHELGPGALEKPERAQDHVGESVGALLVQELGRGLRQEKFREEP